MKPTPSSKLRKREQSFNRRWVSHRSHKSKLRLAPMLEPLEDRLLLTASPLTGGDVLVARIGDGSNALTNLGNPYFLDEYSPNGTLVQSIALPTTGSPPNNAIVNTGSGQVNGQLALSADGRFVTFTGYDFNLPNLSNVNLKGSTAPRDVGRIDISANLDTSTALTDYAIGNTPGAAISTDGNSFYVDTQSGGIRLATRGSSSSSQVVNPLDPNFGGGAFQFMQIYNNQLYVTDRDNIYQVGTGVPGAGSASLTPLPGLSLFNFTGDGGIDFFFATLDPANHGTQPDTLYISQQSNANSGEIEKFSATFSGGVPTNWSPSGFVLAQSVGGLTGYVNGSSVTMFATAGSLNSAGGGTSSGGGMLYSYTDTTGYNGSIPALASVNTLVSGLPANEGFRGIAFVPNQAPVLNYTGTSNLPNIFENVSSGNNPGELVSSVLSGLGANPVVSDSTASQPQGIAITSADQTNGTWQFSTNGGNSWTNFPAVSTSAALTLASNGSTSVRFAPAANYHGSATFTFKAWDQSQGTNGGIFNISVSGGHLAFSAASATAMQTVLYVNQTPSFVRGLDQAILSNAGAQSVSGWATAISPGAPSESGQMVNFIVSNDNNSLFSVQPSISPSGTLTYTSSGTAGAATVTVQIHDDGGTLNGASDTSLAQTFLITVTPVGGNQPPVNSIPFSAQTTLENQALTFSVGSGNLISISDADAGSSLVQVMLSITGGTATLSTLNNLTPISGGGNGTASLTYQGAISDLNAALAGLIFTPTSNTNGIGAGQITIATNDLGNTGTGGANTSTNTITINITPVNQAPSFMAGGGVLTPASGSPYSAQWATNVLPGPSNESSQTVNFVVSNNNPGLFTVQPSISPAGVLSFTSVRGPAGTATVTVQLFDSGGVDHGGVDHTSQQTFLIQLSAVDLAPIITAPAGQRAIKNIPLAFTPAGFNGISFTDPDGTPTGSTEQLTVSATNGTITLASTANLTITSSTPNLGPHSTGPYTSVTVQGLIANLNKALYQPIFLTGLSFTPTTGFVGNATVTVAVNDLSSVSPGPLTTTSTININVVPAPPLEISEVMANPPGTDEPNDFIEIRSATPNYTIPGGTYFVTLSGNSQTLAVGNTLTTYPAGTVFDTFNLSGVTTGSDGYLVILQNGNTYNNYPDFGGLGLIDSRAKVLDNGINPDGSIAIGTGAGFGNNLASPGSSIVGHSALFRAFDTNMLKGSATYMLVNTPNPVTPGDLLDAPTVAGGAPTGTLHGTEYNGWNVYDAVGDTLATTGTIGDVSYGFINYVNTITGSTNFATPNSIVVPTGKSVDYLARFNNNQDWVASDWLAASNLKGLTPTWGLGGTNFTFPATYNVGLSTYNNTSRPLNNLGGPNFDASTPAVVMTTGATLSYPVGSGNKVVDPAVNVSDTDSFFLGSAQVQITGNYDMTTDSLAFPGSLNITGTYTASTGLLTLQGFDTFANWNAALQSVTYNYSASVVDVNHPTRTITFTANDGAVLSNLATRTVMLTGATANPPIITGTSGTALTWTEALPPASPPLVTIAPGLAISDASVSNLTSATVAISAGFVSTEDVLGWSSSVAVSNQITVSYTAGTNKLTLAPTSPDASEPLANFQAVLRTVSYSNASQNPTAAARTATFTVVDTNTITSTVTSNSQQVFNVVPVNNPPKATTTMGSTAYTAGNPALLVDGALTVTDPDSATLVGATVSITGGFAAGDTLGFVNQAGITGTYDSGSGVLTLTGTGAPLDYQIAMRAVTFSSGVGAPGGTRTISFQADDGATAPTPDGNVATKPVVVTAVSPPLVTTSGGATSAPIFSTTVVDSGLTVTDSNANLAGATVSISGGLQAGDLLNFSNQNGISGSYSGGVLTLTGSSSVANYQTALRSITFSSSSNSTATRTVSFTATDGTLTSAPANKQITVVSSTVTNEFVFYKGSTRYDTTGGARSPLAFSDDNAIATDKSAYIPNGTTANFGNYTSYSKGLNGIMVDLLGGGQHTSITLASILSDFQFKVGGGGSGSNSTPGSWVNAPAPTAVTVRPGMTGAANGAGTVSGSDRVEIMWADNAIQQQWLEVIVKPTAHTGVANDPANNVFFFGNEIGNTAVFNTTTVARTGASDVTGAQTHGASLPSNIPISNIYDFDRDGKVGASDVTAAQTHGTSTATGLKLLVIGSGGPFAPDAAAAASPTAAPSTSGDTGVASALASAALGSSPAPTIPTWITSQLGHADLNHGPIAKYFEHLAHESTAQAMSILAAADQIADALGLDDELLDSLVAGLKL